MIGKRIISIARDKFPVGRKKLGDPTAKNIEKLQSRNNKIYPGFVKYSSTWNIWMKN